MTAIGSPAVGGTSAAEPLDHRVGHAKDEGPSGSGRRAHEIGRRQVFGLAGVDDLPGQLARIGAHRALHPDGRPRDRARPDPRGAGPSTDAASRRRRSFRHARNAGCSARKFVATQRRSAPVGTEPLRVRSAKAPPRQSAGENREQAAGAVPATRREAIPAGRDGPSDASREQVIADAARLVEWGRKWYEFAELIARMAGRPPLPEVRRILKDNKTAIEQKAGSAG